MSVYELGLFAVKLVSLMKVEISLDESLQSALARPRSYGKLASRKVGRMWLQSSFFGHQKKVSAQKV